MMYRLFIAFFAAALLVLSASVRAAEPAVQHEEVEAPVSPAARQTMAQLREHFDTLVGLLSQIRDAASADRLGAAAIAAHDSLGQLDFSAFEEEDEEILAFASTSFFYRLADEIARLEEVDFFGNTQLKAHFSGAEEAPEDEETAPEDLSAPEAPASEAETESVVL